MIHSIYDNVNIALWAILITFVVYFSIFVLPHVPEARAKAEVLRALEISAENRTVCEKWGMRDGTHEHTLCTLDLQNIRAMAERRIIDNFNIF
jgi:hypothetical protein